MNNKMAAFLFLFLYISSNGICTKIEMGMLSGCKLLLEADKGVARYIILNRFETLVSVDISQLLFDLETSNMPLNLLYIIEYTGFILQKYRVFRVRLF